jgi:hypothetical protein
VTLKRLQKRGPDGRFQPVSLSVPLTFAWSPSEISPPYITFSKEHVVDFGYVTESREPRALVPKLISLTHSFQGFPQAGQVWRFGLEIEAENFVSRQLQVYEVAWDGGWSDNRETMASHLTIKEVPFENEKPPAG